VNADTRYQHAVIALKRHFVLLCEITDRASLSSVVSTELYTSWSVKLRALQHRGSETRLILCVTWFAVCVCVCVWCVCVCVCVYVCWGACLLLGVNGRTWLLSLPDPVLALLPLHKLVEPFRRFVRSQKSYFTPYAIILQQVFKVCSRSVFHCSPIALIMRLATRLGLWSP